MSSLFWKNLIFTILQPGVVAGLIPYWLIMNNLGSNPESKWNCLIGLILAFTGIVVCMICIIQFAVDGKGTLSPLYPTKSLVIKGFYKYSRNPMYVGVLLTLIGESTYFLSWILAVYTIFIFAMFYTFILLVEEPRLTKDFGEEYYNYKIKVRRWL
jgi:protein-S-isoprenylcysteine O-methyltransferase Ste14